MPSLIVSTRQGVVTELPSPAGDSVMEAIRDAGFDEMLAICGGCLSCATCHVYVDERFLAALPPMQPDEDSLLEGSDHRLANSRLACQLPLAKAPEGLAVRIAPAD